MLLLYLHECKSVSILGSSSTWFSVSLIGALLYQHLDIQKDISVIFSVLYSILRRLNISITCMISADVLAWVLVLEPAGDSCRELPDWQEGWPSFWMMRRDSSLRSVAVQHCPLVVKIWIIQRLQTVVFCLFCVWSKCKVSKVNVKIKTQHLYCLLPFVLEILTKIIFCWEGTKLQAFCSNLVNDFMHNLMQYWDVLVLSTEDDSVHLQVIVWMLM